MNHLKMIKQFLKEKRDFEDLPEYGFPVRPEPGGISCRT
jgi:hypothetical protein